MNLKSLIFKKIGQRMPRVRGFTKQFYFGHPFLDAWFAWFPLNQIQYDGAAVGEVFNAASRIDESRRATSWITEWSAEAERVTEHAENLISGNHVFSAANTFLRAYTYFRTAHLATDPVNFDNEMRQTYECLSYCFQRFRELSGVSIDKIQVPLKKNGNETKQKMHGYFLKAKNHSPQEPAPTIIWLNGAESIAEDVYWWCGAEGMEWFARSNRNE